MERPEDNEYKDITGNTAIPTITKDQVVSFTDNNISDSAQTMYENGYLVFVRMSQPAKCKFYFRGKCRAQMRKAVTYFIDIQLIVIGKHSLIQAAQCECAAGMGPRPK